MTKEYKDYLRQEGWNTEELSDVLYIMDILRDIRYEIENCVRGCNTGAYTYADLKNVLKEYTERLSTAVDSIYPDYADKKDEKAYEEMLKEEEEEDNE